MPAYDARTSLVVVDLQNDFADPAGGLSVTGGDEIVPFVNAEIGAAGAGGALIAYTQDWHPAHTPHFAQDGGVWPVHCVQDTWGANLHPDLVVDGPIVRKGSNGEDGYSGFTMRDQVARPTTVTRSMSRSRRSPSRSVGVVRPVTPGQVFPANCRVANPVKAIGTPGKIVSRY
jgi:nicotinamidase/pyrazinamidase